MDSEFFRPSELERSQSEPCCSTGVSWHSHGAEPAFGQLPLLRERGWNKNLLRVAFGTCAAIEVHSEISVREAQAAVARAVETWNDVRLPARFEWTSSTPNADIIVDWEFSSSDPDGGLSPWTQAHADFPPGNSLYGAPPLPLHFNADFLWGIEAVGRFDIETIALHELGHCLGLIYHSGRQTIMYDAIREAPLFVAHQLDTETIARAQALYY